MLCSFCLDCILAGVEPIWRSPVRNRVVGKVESERVFRDLIRFPRRWLDGRLCSCSSTSTVPPATVSLRFGVGWRRRSGRWRRSFRWTNLFRVFYGDEGWLNPADCNHLMRSAWNVELKVYRVSAEDFERPNVRRLKCCMSPTSPNECVAASLESLWEVYEWTSVGRGLSRL